MRLPPIPIGQQKGEDSTKTPSQVAVCLTVLGISVPCFAQFRIQQSPSPGMSQEEMQRMQEAWRRMDTHSQIDPRILKAQQDAAEAKRKQDIFNAKKMQYAQALRQRVNQNREWRYVNGYPQVGIECAIADASHYLALADTEGQPVARNWLNARLVSIEATIKQQQTPNSLAVAHDTIVAAAALGGRVSGADAPAGIGQAAGMAKTANSLATATQWHYDILRSLTQ